MSASRSSAQGNQGQAVPERQFSQSPWPSGEARPVSGCQVSTDPDLPFPSESPVLIRGLEQAPQGSDPNISDMGPEAACQRHGPILRATIHPKSFALCSANGAFQSCFVRDRPTPDSVTSEAPTFLTLLSEVDRATFLQRYHQHLLARILQRVQPEVAVTRLLSQPITLTAKSDDRLRYIRLWLQSDNLTLHPPAAPVLSDADWATLSPQQLLFELEQSADADPLIQHLQSYTVDGQLLLAGVDVTEQEIVQTLTQLLVEPESFMQPRKFIRVNRLMRSLFRASGCFVLYPENDQARLFTGLGPDDTRTYALQALQASKFLQAAETNQVTHIPDLTDACPTDCERSLLAEGIRALLIVPLVAETQVAGKSSRKLAGVFGLTSDQPYHFDAVDQAHAAALIPALTAAMRQAIQQRFAKIHPAVEWRFAQEAERRSWGFAHEPIVFNDVYPLYGISDIRGSSKERNRAIQSDLLTQFQLALAVIDAVCEAGATAFGQQLHQDLLEHMAPLTEQLTVDAEVTLVRYLQESLEIHFDYFKTCGPKVEQAIAAYQAAQDPDQHCVYQARSQYDHTIAQINTRLRDTWNQWQAQMQAIVPHYCDIETTDGIDHMIYAGPSIAAQFQPFHLRSLRYDQLRAVCDCARTGLALKQELGTAMEITHLVLVQTTTVDIFHDESTESLFDVKGSRDTRYEIVKKRIDKALNSETHARITQPGKLTLVYSTSEDWDEYKQYFRYLVREGWIGENLEFGSVEPLQGVTGLKFARAEVLPISAS